MKRSFKELDQSIPQCIWELCPEKREKLQLIEKLDKDIHTLWASYKRKCLALNCEGGTRQKVLRVYLRHKFVAATADEKSHFLLSIEGRLVDSKIGSQFPLGMFFSAISIQQGDKKLSLEIPAIDWQQSDYPEGSKANCFNFRIYADKACSIKVYLTRSDYALKRFELPPTLRQVFPNMGMSPSEGEVLRALWKYIHFYGALQPGSTEVRLDEKLRAVLGSSLSSCPLHSLRARVKQVLLPCRAISVDYALTLTGWADMGGYKEAPDKRFTSRAMSRAGGRVFDLDVDIVDPYAAPLLEAVNAMTAQEVAMEQPLEQLHRRLGFLATSMLHCAPEIAALQALRRAPIDPLLLAPVPSIDDQTCLARLASDSVAPVLVQHPLLGMQEDQGDCAGSGKRARREEVIYPSIFMDTLTDCSRNIVDRNGRSRESNSHPRRCDIADDNSFST